MKILVVEDAEYRISWFEKKFGKELLRIVTTADEAIKKLTHDINWDYIYLDHDLGGADLGADGFNEKTGTEVAKFLSTKEFKGQIIIHSMNYYGAQSMKSYLPQATICPFSFLASFEE